MRSRRPESWPSLLLGASGLLVAAMAGWMVVGWHGVADLSPSPPPFHFERAAYDTTWALLAMGGALMAFALRLDLVARLLAAVPIVLAGLRLVASLAPDVIRTHPILRNPWLAGSPAPYADTGVLSALIMLVLGCAIASMRAIRSHSPWRSVVLALLAAIAVALSLLLTFGAWSGGAAAEWLQLTGGDLAAGVMFLLLAGAVLAAATLGTEAEQSAVRRATPIIIWFAAFVCVLVLWQALAAQEARFIQSGTSLVAADIRGQIQHDIGERVRLLQRLARRGQLLTEEIWREDAAQLVRDVPELRAIGWAGGDLATRWVVPPSPVATSASLLDVPERREAIETAMRTRQPAFSRFTTLRRGGTGVPIYVPVYDGDAFVGMLVSALGSDNWPESVLGRRFSSYEVLLLERGQPVFDAPADGPVAGAEWSQPERLQLYNGDWTLRVTPSSEHLRRSSSPLPEATLALGTALATLLALATYFFQTAGRRARQLAVANARLTRDIEAREQAEQALRDSEYRIRLIIDAVRDCAIYALDVEGRVSSWSSGAREMTGYRSEEVLGVHFSLLYPADRTTPAHDMLAAASERGWFEEECWHQRKDGTRFCGDDIISPIRDQDGTLHGFSIVTRDATLHIESRTKIERSRDFYFSLFSDFPNLVWRSDASGQCDYLNQAWLDFTGRPREAQLGRGWLDAIHPDDRDRLAVVFEEARAKQQPFEIEFRIRRGSGDYGWLICTSRPYHDMDGNFAGSLCSCYDNTSRRAMEDALKESEERYERIASNVPGMVFKLSRAPGGPYAFAYVSAGSASLTGESPATLMNDAEAFFRLVPAEDRRHLDATLEASSAQVSTWTWGGRLRPFRDTADKWIAIRAKPRRTEDGVTFWDGVVFDDTSNHHAQLEIERSREELRALSRHLQTVREEEKARIAGEVHDELGATLTAMKIDLDWVCSRVPAALVGVHEKCVALGQLIDAAVSATRKIVTDLRPSILDDLGLAAALRWQAGEFRRHTGAAIHVSTPSEDPKLDRERGLALFRIFQETLTNVARHANAREIWVTLSATDDAYVLQVRDDGIGLSRDDLQKPASHGIRGMRERARQLGGDVTVAADVEGGTTMVVTVPRSEARR